MIGGLIIAFSITSALISLIGYSINLTSTNPKLISIARICFHATVMSFMVACFYQMYNILNLDFTNTYIWGHASTQLSKPLLMATFYSGQEGSFMLWTLLTMIIGIAILGYSQKVDYEKEVMATYMLVIVCLLLILVVKSPFETIFASFPDQKIPEGFIPTQGKGLNPTLENLWITIHPPILFTGFASMTVPFVFAIAALIKKDYQKWVTIAIPWVLFSCMVLGFGIMLGGFWAYETLGWGGFWGWDPVENSSLIPWLVCVALSHTLLVEKKTGKILTGSSDSIGGYIKTNFVLAILAYGLILYSTFLTRSGVLGDTSVHSFVDPGNFIYWVLLSIIILFISIGFGTFFYRIKDLKTSSKNYKLISKENALGLGSATILGSALVVFIGTSWPIITPLFGKTKAAIPADFYNDIHLPLAIIITLLNGLSIKSNWKESNLNDFLNKLKYPFVFSILGSIGLYLLGIKDFVFIILGFTSLFALSTNLQIGYKVIKGNPKFIGAYVSHAGIALLMLGIIFTSRYSQSKHIRLIEGESSNAFGYKITYKGADRIEEERTDLEKHRHNIILEKDGKQYTASPIVFWSDFNKREGAFLEPGIHYTLTKDIYISPKEIDVDGGDPKLSFKKGSSFTVPFDSTIKGTFVKFDMSRGASENLQGAMFQFISGDSTISVTSFRQLKDGSYRTELIPGTDVKVGFSDIKVDKSDLSKSEAIVTFSSPRFPPKPTKRVFVFDASVKPFISFVWIGVIIMVLGFFWSIIRRKKDLNEMKAFDNSLDEKVKNNMEIENQNPKIVVT